MVQADNLCLAYGGQVVFEDASFSIQKGEKCGLIGRNGMGKSTLFRLLTGAEELDKGVIVLPKGYRIGFLQQQIRFTKDTVLEEAALGLRPDDQEALYKVERILFGLGFGEEDMYASPHGLSGGYQLRVQLAKVLVSEPDCLLLDEPTNYLDIISIRFLGSFLKNWQGEMILISHDLQFLDEATTHMMCIQRHKIHKIKGKSKDLLQLIIDQEELHEINRQNLEKKKAHLQSFIDRFGAKASKATQAQSRQKQIDRLPVLEQLKDLYGLAFNFNEAPFMGRKMLEATHLKFAYKPEIPLIEDFSLTIEKGDRIAIIGKNGYGKSTLLKLLIKELEPASGTLNTSEVLKVGYFGQTSIERLTPKLRVEEEIAEANPLLNFSQVRAICGLMMFSSDLAKKTVSVLSGGEKSRVLLGRIIAKPCNLLLLDEPTHHLDVESIEALIDAIEDFKGSVVVVTHSEWVLRRIAFNKLIVCNKEKQEEFLGGYDEFLEKIGWQDEQKAKEKKVKADPLKESSKPSKQEIKKCEDAIASLEKNIEGIQEKIANTPPSDGKKMKEHANYLEREQKKLDALFATLETLYKRMNEE